jgi:hypothetical protein
MISDQGEWLCDFTHCGDRAAYYIEWDEQNSQVLQFGGLYCNPHTAAMRAGWSPFEEWGTTPMIRLVRTYATHRALCEASYAVERVS